MFSFNYNPRYGDYKDYNNIKVGSLLDMIQDVSTRASAECGYDINTLRNLGIAWLLQGVNVHLLKPIRPDMQIEISTAVKPSNGVTSERICIIRQNGEIVGKSVSAWFIFNTQRQRPVRIPKEMLSAYEVFETDDALFNYTKTKIHIPETKLYTVRVSNKEIDTNMHMNNQRGADLLMDALPFNFIFNDINLFYKKPAFLGDELEVCICEIENGYYVQLQSCNEELYVAGTFRNV